MRKLLSTDEFEEFYNSLESKTQEKFDYTMNVVITEHNISTKFVKKLVGTSLYEMRVPVGKNAYRTILFAVDNENIILSQEIILLNGFLKKSTKDYDKQIKKAEQILKNLSHD